MFTGLGNVGGVGDIIAYVGLEGDAQFNAKLRGLDASVNKTAGIMDKALTASLVAAAAAFVASVAAAAKFESQMANVNTLLDNSDTNFGALNDGLLDIAKSLPTSVGSLTSGLYDLISAGADSSTAIGTLKLAAEAASAGITGVDVAVRAGMATINAYGLDMSELSKVYDLQFSTVKKGVLTYEQLSGAIGNVLPSAASLGVSLEDLYGSLAAVTKGGIEANSAATYLARAFESMVENRDKWKELGVAIFDTTGNFRGLQPVIGDLAERLKGLSSEEKQITLEALDMEKRAAKSVLTMVNNYEGFSKTMDAVADSAGAMKDAFDKQTETFEAQVKILKNQLHVAFIEFGKTITPILTDITMFIGKIINTESSVSKLGATIDGLNESFSEHEKINSMIERYEELKNKTELTRTEQSELKSITADLAEEFPRAVTAVDKYGRALSVNTEYITAVVKEQKALMKLQMSESFDEMTASLVQYLSSFEDSGEKIGPLLNKLTGLTSEHEKYTAMLLDNKDNATLKEFYSSIEIELNKASSAYDNIKNTYDESKTSLTKLIPVLANFIDLNDPNAVIDFAESIGLSLNQLDTLNDFIVDYIEISKESQEATNASAEAHNKFSESMKNTQAPIDKIKTLNGVLPEIRGNFDQTAVSIDKTTKATNDGADATKEGSGAWTEYASHINNVVSNLDFMDESVKGVIGSITSMITSGMDPLTTGMGLLNIIMIAGSQSVHEFAWSMEDAEKWLNEVGISVEEINQNIEKLNNVLLESTMDEYSEMAEFLQNQVRLAKDETGAWAEQLRDLQDEMETMTFPIQFMADIDTLLNNVPALTEMVGDFIEYFSADGKIDQNLGEMSEMTKGFLLDLYTQFGEINLKLADVQPGSAVYGDLIEQQDAVIKKMGELMKAAGVTKEQWMELFGVEEYKTSGWTQGLQDLGDAATDIGNIFQAALYDRIINSSEESVEAIDSMSDAFKENTKALKMNSDAVGEYRHLWTGTAQSLGQFADAMAAAGIETTKHVKEEIALWESLLPNLKEGSYEWEQLLEKINAGYEKIGLKSPWEKETAAMKKAAIATRTQADIMSGFGIKSEKGIWDQIAQLEDLKAYYNLTGFELEQVNTKLTSLYGDLGITTPWEAQRLAVEEYEKALADWETQMSSLQEEMQGWIDKLQSTAEIDEKISNIINTIKTVSALGENPFGTIIGSLRAMNIEIGQVKTNWSNMLDVMFKDYTDMEANFKTAKEALDKLAYFKIDIDGSGIEGQMNYTIWQIKESMKDLSPDSQAYKDADAMLESLAFKFVSLGGVIDEQMAVDFAIDQALAILNQELSTAQIEKLEIELSNMTAEEQIAYLDQKIADLELNKPELNVDTEAADAAIGNTSILASDLINYVDNKTIYFSTNTTAATQGINLLKTDIGEINNKTIYFSTNTSAAMQGIGLLIDKINSIPTTVTITATYHEGSTVPSYHTGDLVTGHEGLDLTLGTYKGREEMLAKVTKGEFIVRPEAVNAFGADAFKKANDDLDPSGFQGSGGQAPTIVIREATPNTWAQVTNEHISPQERINNRNKIGRGNWF